jgi:hypothetical protein
MLTSVMTPGTNTLCHHALAAAAHGELADELRVAVGYQASPGRRGHSGRKKPQCQQDCCVNP